MFASITQSAVLLAIVVSPLWTRSVLGVEFSADLTFNRDIRPILSDNCFHCHGPDEAQRQANLRLDTQDGAFAELESGNRAIVPGNASGSELVRRIMSADDSELMPPPDSARKLTATQRDVLQRWIQGGASWQKHWSLIPPERPALPKVSNPEWPREVWDRFVLARLESEGLQPSAEADKSALLRRVTLDLTGLPPTLEELESFQTDQSSQAYEKVVDRLLASPRFGERMATDWLDAARYADTNGYQSDGIRHMWRWRDWVIDALNRNMPFDQFTIEQLAGDMLEGATLDQQIATGFNRNHRGNAEGGIIPQEYAVEYVVDRVDTTATVWLGLTLGCARCHDHKFDPVSQREFYQLFALFNNVPERGRATKYGNSDPQIKSPTPKQQANLREIEEQLAACRAELDAQRPQIDEAQATWEKTLRDEPSRDWWPGDGLLVDLPLDGSIVDRCNPSGKVAANQANLTFPVGQIGAAAEFSGEQRIDVGDVASFGFLDPFSISLWVQPQTADGVMLGRMEEAADASGYTLQLDRGKLQLNLIVRWLDDALRVETTEPLEMNRWRHVVVTYDGSRAATGVKIYLDGQPAPLNVLVDELNQTFKTKSLLRIGAGGPGPRYAGKLDELRIYGRKLLAEEAEVSANSTPLHVIAALPAAERSPAQSKKLAACFLDRHAPASTAEIRSKLLELEKQKMKLDQTIPTTMVMQELPEQRATFVLTRGEYDKPAERVLPGVPASVSWEGQPSIHNRLDFARWLVSPQNPLTARVTVNRIWQLYFGQGLVKTVNDFGSQGERPSHPELLDFLAIEFISRGWNVKALHKSIVMSATYRQSSQMTPMLTQRDPENRLLARGPRLRLSAEMVRDQALAVSDLLTQEIGGPSVFPYQPVGLWKELGDADFKQDHGEALYRRSLYTFWKRTAAPPTMIAFDAAGRESCRVLQTRTNTPLQALALMNEVTFVEAARKLAERVLREENKTSQARLETMFRLVLVRAPTPDEASILSSGLARHLEHYRRRPEAASNLLALGESPRDKTLDVTELAAYTATANLILNLDETITKP
ncbi:MAG: hypothetical protein C0485_02470 [Pirellula sp.]|nr:hypothetical protein [Pirellula sp.]